MSGSSAAVATEMTLGGSTQSEGGGTQVPPPSVPTRHRHRGVGWRTRLEITVLSGPAIIVFVAFVIVPVIVALYYSFYSWKGFGPATDFVGWSNYKWTLTNSDFWNAVKHNGVIIVLSLVMQGPLAILMALLLNQKMRGRSIIRVLIFVPYVVSEAIIGIGLKLMLSTDGAVNGLLADIGIHTKVAWLSNPSVAIWTLMFILTWKYIGFAVILMLAGLQGIPEELSEAAAVDGASYWQTQWHIMLPLLTPTIKIWAFLSIIGSMQLFDIVYIIWGQYIGNIAGVSTMAYFMAGNGRLSGELGRGSAIAIIIFIISLIVALAYQRLVLNRNTDGALTDGGDE